MNKLMTKITVCAFLVLATSICNRRRFDKLRAGRPDAARKGRSYAR